MGNFVHFTAQVFARTMKCYVLGIQLMKSVVKASLLVIIEQEVMKVMEEFSVQKFPIARYSAMTLKSPVQQGSTK